MALLKNNDVIAEVLDVFRAAESFLVTSHNNPDGDAIGSMLGIYHLLRALGKKDIVCINEDPVPRNYMWLAGASEVCQSAEGRQPADVAIILDVARSERLGSASAQAVAAARNVVVVDHHLEEHPAGNLNFIDPSYAAVGEMVAELFAGAGMAITPEAAECLYVSIITDTGGFRFANTTSRTHRIAATLLETGIDVAEISCRVFDELSMGKFKLLTLVLQRMKSDAGGRVAYSVLTVDDIRESAADLEDFSGLVDFARNIRGVDVGILFREVAHNATKVSVRSHSTFNSAKFLRAFGGGGHAGAAGATVELPLKEACELVLAHIRKELNGK